MSMYALLQAVRNRLREATATGGLAYNAKDCDIAPPNGQPPPLCGPFFVAVHEGNLSGNQSYSDLDTQYSVSVTVTMRLRGTPYDRWVQKELYGADDTSLDNRCRKIMALIHQDTIDHRIINAANVLTPPPAVGYTVQGFVEPLRFERMDTAREVGPAWFWADPSQPENQQITNCGWAKTLRFTGARRIQEAAFAEGIGVVS